MFCTDGWWVYIDMQHAAESAELDPARWLASLRAAHGSHEAPPDDNATAVTVVVS